MQIFRAALAASDPEHAVLAQVRSDGRTLITGKRRYSLTRFQRVFVVGAGKASGAMAAAVEKVLGRRISGGWVNVPDGTKAHTRRITLHPSRHPIPDERGAHGAEQILRIARDAGKDDLVIGLISGGASALMPSPIQGLSLAAKQELTARLLGAGATIHEINTVRKHLSAVKGGQLACATYPATLVTLILSDVIGDDLATIGSGPTVGDPTTVDDARRVLQKFGIASEFPWGETPKEGDTELSLTRNLIVGSNRQAMAAAEKQAKALGYRTLLLSTVIEGDTREVAGVHAAIVREVLQSGRPVRPPACILSGGETTVTIRGRGKGGRNQEFVLAAQLKLGLEPRVTVFSAGTDGIDGPTDAAGAMSTADTAERAQALGLDGSKMLANNDSYHYFEPLNALIRTGPTGTNVMDIRLFLIA